MMKRIRLAAAVTAAMLLTACGSKEYVKDIKAEKYVTLGQYKGIEVTVNDPTVTEEAVDNEINALLANSKVEIEKPGNTVEEGDTVNIDYVGYRDGVAFEGGTGNSNLEIGSGSFIEGFEDGLIGHTVGEDVTLNLTFPDDYKANAELAGAEVVFEVKINSFMGAAELDDAFVESLGMDDCKTVEELKEYVRNYLSINASSTYESQVESEILSTLTANCTFKELPEEMVDRFYHIWLDNAKASASMYGMTLSQYLLQSMGINIVTDLDAVKGFGDAMAKQYVMLQAIADAEGLSVSDEEMESEALNYGYESVEDFRANADIENFREYLMTEKVRAFVKENAVINTVTPETEQTEAEQAETEQTGTEQTETEQTGTEQTE